MKYLECMMKVLETLEKADTFNQFAVLIECAKHFTIPNPETFQALSNILKSLSHRDNNLPNHRPLAPKFHPLDKPL